MSEAQAVAEPVAPPAAPSAPPAEAVTTPAQPAASAPAQAEKPTGDSQEKTGHSRYQRRIDKAYRRAAEAQGRADMLEKRLAEMEARTRANAVDPDEPKLESFSDIGEYAKAVKEHAASKARKEDESRRNSEAQRQFLGELTASWEEKADKASKKYDDFDAVVGELQPTNALVVAIMDEENGAEVAYHLAKNPDEARRIAALNPLRQARAIGRLAEKLASQPEKQKMPSQAPAPITPLQAANAANTATELRDGMDYRDFVKIRNRQLGRVRA